MANEVEIVVKSSDKTKPGFTSARDATKDFVREVEQASAKVEKLGDAAQETGRETVAATESAREKTEELGDAADKAKRKVKGLGDEAPKVSAEFDLLQAQALRLNAAFDKMNDKHVLDDASFKEALGAMTKVQDKAAETGDRLRKLGDDGDSAGGNIAKGFTKNLSEGLSGVAPAFTSAIGPAIAGAAPLLAAAGAVAGGAVVFGFGAGIAGLGLTFAAHSAGVKSEATQLKDYIATEMNKISAPLQQTWLHATDDARSAFDKIKGDLRSAFDDLAPDLSRFSGNLFDGFAELGSAVGPLQDAFSAVLNDLGPRLPRIFGDIADSLSDLSDSVSKSPQAFGDFVEGVGDMVEAILWLTEVSNDAWPSIKGLLTIGRSWSDDLADAAIAAHEQADAVGKMGDAAFEARSPTQQLTDAMKELAEAEGDIPGRTKAIVDILDILAGRTPSYDDAIQTVNDSIRDLNQMFDTDGSAAQNAAREVAGYGEALLNADGSVSTVTENGSKLKDVLDGLQEATAGQTAAVRELEEAGWSHDAAIAKVNGDLAGQRERLLDTAEGMGITRDQMQRLLDKYGLTPKNLDTVARLDENGVPGRLDYIARNRSSTITIREIYAAQEYSSSVGGKSGQYSGGYSSTAATGGQRHGATLVNEYGPEVIDLPNGSRVIPAGMSREMDRMVAGGNSGSGAVKLVFGSDGSELGDLLVRIVQLAVQHGGGDVQEVLGQPA